jgi:hypothetical protein
MDRSLRFRVYPHELSRPLGLAFAPAPGLRPLALLMRSNSPDHNAKGTQSPHRSPKRPVKLPPLVGTRFQVLFHSPPGVLFTFPSRYSCTIGRRRVFSLGGWSPQFRPELLGSSGLLRNGCHTSIKSSPTGLSPALAERSSSFRLLLIDRAGQCPTPALQPRTLERVWFGLLRVRSPLLAQSRLISLPPGTEMFQFPGLALP